MKKLEFKLNLLVWKTRSKVNDFLYNEDGDTNFISIIIIMAIVLLMAIVFIAFKDKIVQLVNSTWTKFSTSFGGQTISTPETVTPP
ncbi:MAG: hypothetical protein IJZ53_01370 [Tyzzerella sp.]|nr:hypothetical protein [Tyzzerella sp.]